MGRAHIRSSGRYPGLAGQRRRAGDLEQPRLVQRQVGPGVPLPILQRLDRIAKARNRDPPRRVVQGRKQPRQRRDRVLHRAAINPRVQIDRRAR